MTYKEDVYLLKVMENSISLKIINEIIKYKKLNVIQLIKILGIPQSTKSQYLSKLRRIILIMKKR